MEKFLEQLKSHKIKVKVGNSPEHDACFLYFPDASDYRIEFYGEINTDELTLILYNNGKEEKFSCGKIADFNEKHLKLILEKHAEAKELISKKETCVWTKGDCNIEFKNGSMQYHKENKVANSLDAVLYFYYDVEVKLKGKNHRKKKHTFDTYDFPKVQNMHLYIDEIVNFDIKNKGYVFEDYKNTVYVKDGVEKIFHRKIFYHQVELRDFMDNEYFVRFERYDYEVKQADEDDYQFWTTYKMTIGQMPSDSTSNACEAIFFSHLTAEDLMKLKEVGLRFVQRTMEEENECILARSKNII